MREIEIKVGETYAEQGEWTDDDTGAPVDLTGYTAACQLRTRDDELVGALEAAIDPGSGGTFVLSADASATAAWPPGLYLADIRFVSPGGEVHQSPTFFLRVVPRITEEPA